MFSKIKEYIRQSKDIGQDKEFNNLYKQLEVDILDIEDKRRKSIIRIISIYIAIIVLSILFIGIFSNIRILPKINLIFIMLITIIIFKSTTRFLNEKEEYINKYKSDILIKVIQEISKDKIYFSKKGISLTDYLQAGFETKNIFNEYKSSDYIGIETNNKKINLYNIKLNYKEIVDNKTITNNIFSGIYAYVMCNKKIENIRIEKNIQNLISREGQVILDNQNFEKYFNIFSRNRMLTMQVLTPQVMEKLLEFIKKNFTNFEIIIKDNKIHFKIYTQIIHPPMYVTLTKGNEDNKRYVYYYYSIFKFIIELTQYLSNTIDELNI